MTGSEPVTISGKAVLAERHRLAGQPFQRAVRADMDERMAAERFAATGRRRAVRGAAAASGRDSRRGGLRAAAIGGERDGDVAEARGAEGEGLVSSTFEVGVLSRPPLSCRTSPPQGGRLDCRFCFRQSATLAIGETPNDGQSPPLWGRCPAGQRGATSSAYFRSPSPTPPPPPLSLPPAASRTAPRTPPAPNPRHPARPDQAARAANPESLQRDSPRSSGRAAWRARCPAHRARRHSRFGPAAPG